ncbi:MAG TPA: hypothetical protein VIM84_07540 [Gemmatimonadales bacterium]
MLTISVVSERFRRELATVTLFCLGLAGPLGAQVGLQSGQAQVSLVARAAPGGLITAVGTDRDAGVVLRVSANTGYRVVARSIETGNPGERVWVRSVGGELQELTPGASITVARGEAASDWEQQVELRLQSGDIASQHPLPVRYDLYIDPTL